MTAALLLLEKRPLKLLQPAALVDAVAAAQHPSGGISRTIIPPKPNAESRSKHGCPENYERSSVPLEDGDSADSSLNTPLWFLSGGGLSFAKKQQTRPDPFHTFFALAGLSLISHSNDTELQQVGEGQQQHEWQEVCRRLLRPLDPVTALPRGLI